MSMECQENMLLKAKYVDIKNVLITSGNSPYSAEIGGVNHRFSGGGVHGSRSNYKVLSTDSLKIMDVDFCSFYPLVMLGHMNEWVYSAMSRNRYKKLLVNRIKAKFDGNLAEANRIKNIIDPIYGLVRRENADYGLEVCKKGQTIMLEFLYKLLSVEGVVLINTNTDGVIVSYPASNEPVLESVIEAYKLKVRIPVEYKRLHSIYVADINCYAADIGESYVYVKGEKKMIAQDQHKLVLKGLKASPIVEEAVAKSILYGEDCTTTINACTDPAKFTKRFTEQPKSCRWQVDHKWRILPNADIPIFATKNKLFGPVVKVNERGIANKLSNTAEHCIVDYTGLLKLKDIDTDFYILQARNYITKFYEKVGIKL